MIKSLATYPLTKQLLNLVQVILSNDERAILEAIINSVIDNLSLGHSCLLLDEYCNRDITKIKLSKMVTILNKSGLVYNFDNSLISKQIMMPLVLVKVKDINGSKYLLYITRYFYYEQQISSIIKKLNILNQQHLLDTSLNKSHTSNNYKDLILIIDQFIQSISCKSMNGFPNEDQVNALTAAALNKFSIITGGPGTGKTTTVVLLLLLLFQIYTECDVPLNIYVCAPTGKAAMRARRAVELSLATLTDMLDLKPVILENLQNIKYGTLHKLLGYKTNNIYFKHNAQNLLKIDILVVDESSMISLPLFYKLLSALNLEELKHLILLGDKNQLSAVEEGHVFAPVVDYYLSKYSYNDLLSSNNLVNTLTISNRNQGDINLFSKYILAGEADSAKSLINSNSIFLKQLDLNKIIVELFSKDSVVSLHAYMEFINEYGYYQKDMEQVISKVFEYYTRTIVLCVTNNGLLGIDNVNQQIENAAKHRFVVGNSLWYVGRPIIILENDYHLNLYNGDIGICVIKDGVYTILFEDGRFVIPAILPSYKTAYAITIHKSQGSEYDNVVIMLPSIKNGKSNNNTQLLLTKELLYTAVTRAKSRVMLYADIEVVQAAIVHNFKRQTGLSYLLDL